MSPGQNQNGFATDGFINGTPTFFLGIVEPGGDVTIEKRFPLTES